MSKFWHSLVLIFCIQQLNSQELIIHKTNSPIEIDGEMNEEAWENAMIAKDFIQYFPFDTSLAKAKTEVRVTYDDQYIYVFANMYSDRERPYVVPSLRRDYRGPAYDGFTVVLDTYQDKTNAFVFGVNPYGVQREGLISNGGNSSRGGGGSSGNTSFSLSWDNKWFAEAKIRDSLWTAEIAIPFKTIRYNDFGDSWYVNFYRIDSDYNERSTWSPIPRNFSLINLAYNKAVTLADGLPSPGQNISVIPYTAFSASRNIEDGEAANTNFDIGGDAKVAISSALNLDLTINPDFSQVEVDEQVTNLDRFEIFFPERRQFFLENADLFSSFGSRGARPFFSRRIGIARDTTTGTNISNPLYFGARLSGNIGSRSRVGFMTIQAAAEDEISLPSTNYSVASFQHRVGQRSNISAIFINKQAFQDTIGGEFDISPNEWNRTVGVDFNLATPDNRWNSKIYYHQSFEQIRLEDAFSLGLSLNHQTNIWEFRTDFRAIGDNFNPEVGFVRRTNFAQFRGTIYRNFYPARGIIQSHAPGFDFDVLRSDSRETDWDVNLLYRINFRNTSRFSMRLRRQYTWLFDSFDPSGTDGVPLSAFTEYAYNFVIARFNSDERKSLFYELSTISGQYFNGNRINLEGTLSYRFGLIGTTSVNFEYNKIRLPEPYNDADLSLIGLKFDITFSRNVFLTSFFQYNEQINNLNINTRLQWRFQPVSDLFIVYTDNYLAGLEGRFVDFNQPKSRAIVVKLNYWLNL